MFDKGNQMTVFMKRSSEKIIVWESGHAFLCMCAKCYLRSLASNLNQKDQTIHTTQNELGYWGILVLHLTVYPVTYLNFYHVFFVNILVSPKK